MPEKLQSLFDNIQWFEIFKIVAAIAFGGFAGAWYNNRKIDKRNEIQPVGRKLTVTYVDLPKIMHGYEALITVKSRTSGNDYQSQLFERLAIVRVELSNDGNKDFDKFDVGINLPDGTEAIGFQPETSDRYHKISCKQEVSMENRTDELDFQIIPFQRGEVYSITLVAKTDSQDLLEKITLSKIQPVKFVDFVQYNFEESMNELAKLHNGSLVGSVFIAPISLMMYFNKMYKLMTNRKI